MVAKCTKFRLFNLLLVFGIINVLVFKSYFHSNWGAFWPLSPNGLIRKDAAKTSLSPSSAKSVSGRVSLNKNQSSDGSSSAKPVLGRVSLNKDHSDGPVTKQVEGTASSAAASLANGTVVQRQRAPAAPVSQASSGAVDGLKSSRTGDQMTDRAVQAWGKLVKPRANVTVPWRQQQSNASSTLCPLIPSNLVGRLQTYTQAPDWAEIVRLNPGLEPGGHYQPAQCQARHRVAVVIPYRDREEHLSVLLHNLHPMLIRQQLDYFVIVVELAQPTKFNRALLLNIGAVEAGGLWPVQCFIFHDVDLVPEDDRNLYTCPEMPRHMSVAVDKFKYKLPYQGIMGGVTALSKEHFYKINGYSNQFFGWGGEDDDISYRVRAAKLKITRYPIEIARYSMIRHTRDKNNEPNPKRFAMLKTVARRQPVDGLNSLQYQVLRVEFRPAYTWILVSVDTDTIMKDAGKSP